MANISAVINVVPEEAKYLSRALASLKGFASEVVVVDMSDGMEIERIAAKYNGVVYKHKRVNYVEPARNFGISKANGDWVFIIDPDEEVSRTLVKKLKGIVEKNEVDYLRIPRKNIVFGKWMEHSRWWPDYNIRFFKKGYVSWNEIIHGVPITQGNGAELPAKEELAIAHNNYESIDRFMEHLNRYTSVQADLISKKYKFNWSDLLIKPASEFLSRFFAGSGYKDGVHGLALAGLQSFSEFIVYLKVWQSQRFSQEKTKVGDVISVMKLVESDYHYWQADALVKEKGGIIPRIKRKFRI